MMFNVLLHIMYINEAGAGSLGTEIPYGKKLECWPRKDESHSGQLVPPSVTMQRKLLG